ncbi:hypothetical protein SAMN02745157_0661 [Kaistia soli DSM 19436]|uniref:Uncharacterized protein n=1 Tax=Kaistia soli DSM 19436 TaxID=1122133 RepID=A0A1M4VBM1_9HYPH|nr:hypothetical protein [Kaistia soli]SHE66349.1 hypothetical protein SAMN02745157_0661 [Kaistia soli DSM 19436]
MHDESCHLDVRIQELLEANTSYLQRARDAEARAQELGLALRPFADAAATVKRWISMEFPDEAHNPEFKVYVISVWKAGEEEQQESIITLGDFQRASEMLGPAREMMS